MLEDAHLSLVVTSRPLLAGFPAVGGRGHLRRRRRDRAVGQPAAGRRAGRPRLCDLHLRLHRQAEGRARHARQRERASSTPPTAGFGFGRDDVWTLFHSYAFDFSVWEIWGALLYGGRLVVVPYWVSRDPGRFHRAARARARHRAQPDAVRVPAADPGRRRTRRRARLRAALRSSSAAKRSSCRSLRPWFERHGDEQPHLVNMYGITETTVHVTYRPHHAGRRRRRRGQRHRRADPGPATLPARSAAAARSRRRARRDLRRRRRRRARLSEPRRT